MWGGTCTAVTPLCVSTPHLTVLLPHSLPHSFPQSFSDSFSHSFSALSYFSGIQVIFRFILKKYRMNKQGEDGAEGQKSG